MATLAEQLAQQQRKVADWQHQQQQQVKQQAEQARQDVRKQVSDVEKTAQETLKKTQEQKAIAVRKKALRKSFDIRQAKQIAKETEEARKGIVKKGTEAQEDISKAEKETKAEIEQQATKALTDLQASYQEIVANNTELSTGELIPNEVFNDLSKDDQSMLKKLGVDKFNEAKEKEWKASNIQTGKKDEWISKELYDELSKEDQEYLATHSLKEFNIHLEQQWKRNHKQLKSGEWVSKELWDSLEPKLRTELNNRGIEGFNQYQTDIAYQQYIDLAKETDTTILSKEKWGRLKPESKTSLIDKMVEQQYKILSTGEMINKDWYDNLPTETEKDKARLDFLDKNGLKAYYEKYYHTTAFGEIVDKDWLSSLDARDQVVINEQGLDVWEAATYVTLAKTGELIYKNTHIDGQGNLVTGYNDMTPEYQQVLQTQGIAGLEAHQLAQQTEFESKNIQLSTGEWIPKKSYTDKDGNKITGYNDLSKADQQLIMSLGVVQYGLAKDQEIESYINSLPPRAQDWISRHGIEAFNEWLEKADKETNEAKEAGILTGIGLIPLGAVIIGKNKEGEIEYTKPPKVISLDNIDWDNLTKDDYSSIVAAIQKQAGVNIWLGGTSKAYIDWLNKQTPEHREIIFKIQKEGIPNRLIDAASLIFPPAQALKPDIAIEDISGVDWAIGAASIALLVAAPALGVIGKTTGIVGKVATVAGKTVQLGAVVTFPTVTAIEWKKMTPTQRTIAVALNVAIVGALYGKTIVKGLKTITSKVKGDLTKSTKIITQLSKAVKAGNTTKIKTAAKELERLGTKVAKTNPAEGKVLQQQARFFYDNATSIAEQTAKMPSGASKLLDKISKGIKTAAKSEVGEVKFPRWMERGVKEGIFKSAPIEPSKVVIRTVPKVTTAMPLVEKTALIQRVQKLVPKTLVPGATKQASANVVSQIAKELGLKAAVQKIIIKQLAQKVLQQASQGLVRIPVANVAPAQWQPTLITKLTKAIMTKLIMQWEAMSASKALLQMITANMVTVAIATRPKTVTSIIAKSDLRTQAKVQSVVSPKLNSAIVLAIKPDISAATLTQSITRLQSIAKADIKTTTKAITKVRTQVQTAAKTATKALAKTKALVQAQTEAITKAATEVATSALTKGATLTETKALTEAAVDTLVKTITDTAVKTEVKTQVSKIVGSAIATARIATKTAKKATPKPPPIMPKLEVKKEELTPEQKKGAVGWKQGFIYIYVYPPYGEKQIIYSRTPIKGIKLHKGAKSAYESITRIGKGKLPAKIQRDMGIMDITITTKGKKPKISFKRDIKQKTRLTPRVKVSR